MLLISGSSRTGSANAAVLATAAQLAPPGTTTETYDALTDLPIFNPDDDEEGEPVPAPVATMRAAIARADAILACTPEYAGALPAGLKNLLEWTIGDAGTHGKPVAWINAQGTASPTGGALALESLRHVLGYAGAAIVEEAVTRLPVIRAILGDDGTVAGREPREAIAAAVEALTRASARP